MTFDCQEIKELLTNLFILNFVNWNVDCMFMLLSAFTDSRVVDHVEDYI